MPTMNLRPVEELEGQGTRQYITKDPEGGEEKSRQPPFERIYRRSGLKQNTMSESMTTEEKEKGVIRNGKKKRDLGRKKSKSREARRRQGKK